MSTKYYFKNYLVLKLNNKQIPDVNNFVSIINISFRFKTLFINLSFYKDNRKRYIEIKLNKTIL